MAVWKIYYTGGIVVTGTTAEEWRAAPYFGVQYVVLMEPYPDGRRPWRNVSDRQIWTGDDFFDPFGWGEKEGELISDDEYFGMWDEVAYGND